MARHATSFKHRKRLKKSKNPHAVALGHRGGLTGGPARAAALTQERRTQIARMGGRARVSGA